MRITHGSWALALASTMLLVAACGGGNSTNNADAGGNPNPDAMGPKCGDGTTTPPEECDDGDFDDNNACHNDCTLSCGDGTVQTSEKCDTAIAAGQPGACPTTCDDGDACTTDNLVGTECQAECMHGTIAAPADGDGCCPAGATSATDSDCSVMCGNGLVEAGETCDTAIAMGQPGACPIDCNDNVACTTDALVGGGTCTAACTNTTITTPANGDGCCPMGANIGNDNDCSAACGDGVLTAPEVCDTAIATGQPGACPTLAACNDGMACTTDTLFGGGTCNATCNHAVITMPANGDGCCPAGANSNSDSDCMGVCGNGVKEVGESCDTGIAAGQPGACPTNCNDMMACTTDTLVGGGTCAATCQHSAITMPVNGDGCCPSGATIATDSDCPKVCGDGVVSAPETCDTAITMGTGTCPTLASCNDMNACTNDSLVGGGTCNAACSHSTITMPANGDGCCPTGANANTDSDCAPKCGNSVIESGEQCDDGNVMSGDGCSSTCQTEIVPTGFRFSDMDLRDPHTFVNFIGCHDVTDAQFFGFATNSKLQDSITMDTDGDGLLDLSIVAVFRPLAQALMTNPLEVSFPDCTSPLASTVCTLPGTKTPTLSTATNMTMGTCLSPLAGTVKPYSPAVTNATGPCFVSDAETLTITLAGIPIVLSDARVAATYSGNPATGLVNGLVRGFISETDANNTILPMSLPLVGGMPLSSLLPGGTGSCASGDDRDIGPGGVKGWYFYLNFVATARPYSP